MKEWLNNWFDFREGNFVEEDDFFSAIEDIGIQKQELKVTS